MQITEDISDSLSDQISEFLSRVARVLDPFGIEDVSGYGTTIEISQQDDETVSMHRFCWCDGHDCAWCAGCEDEIDDLTDEARAAFDRAGFVPGHGAPNFRFRSEGFEARVWWYKYIGRGMDTDLDETRLAELTQRFDAWAVKARLAIAKASLENWFCKDVFNLEPEVLETMRDAFLAHLAQAEGPEQHQAACEKIKAGIKALHKQSSRAQRCDQMEAALDKAGIPREDPDFPLELFGPLSPAYRLERVLFHGGSFPTSLDDEMPEPAPLGSKAEGEEIPF